MPLTIQALNQSGQNIQPETFANRFCYYGNIVKTHTLWKIQFWGWRKAATTYRSLRQFRGKIFGSRAEMDQKNEE